MRTKMYVRIAIIVCVLFVTLNSGTAAINTWTDSASGSWGTAINWDAGVPAGSDDISISQEGTYTVTVDDDTANNDLGMAVTSITVEASSGLPELAIDFTNSTKILTVGSGNIGTLKIGTTSGTHGLLSITTGQVSAAHLHLGEGGAASTGEARISAGTITLRSNATGLNWLRLGNTAGSTGTVVMTGGELIGPGYGGTYGNIGGAGKGNLIISNGLFTVGGYGLSIGAAAGEGGDVHLLGGELKLTKGYIEVGSGNNSRGSILIDGGTLTVINNYDLTLGVRSGSSGVMTISNGVLNCVDGDLVLGSRAGSYGELNNLGGTNFCDAPIIGDIGTGVVNVAVSGYVEASGYTQLAKGLGGRGILNISAGLYKINGSGTIMGDGNGAWSEINVTGGEFNASGKAMYLRSGMVNVNGGIWVNGTTYIGTTGGTGPIAKTGSVTVTSGTLTLGNTTVGAADRPGYLTIEGKNSTNTLTSLTATTTNSTLRFTLDTDGVSPITVNNALTVNADTDLVIDITNYNNINGLSMALIDYGSVSGTIAYENITFIGGIGTVDQVTNTKISITIIPPTLGTVIIIQ